MLTTSGVQRSDMRSSFGSLSGTATGVRMDITVTVVDVSDGCTPLSNYAIYIWHCDRNGDYSIYDLPSQNYLRAVGVTDSNGQVTFTSIVPGCYNGRYPHIHFEVFASLAQAVHYNNRLLVSQMAIPQAVCNTVYDESLYSSSKSAFSGESTSSDNIFSSYTSAQLAAMTLTMTGDVTNGYTATVTVGLA